MKLYVLVDKSLSQRQKWVQAAHAVAQYLIEIPDGWRNRTLVILECSDIEKEAERADAIFREPYFGNKITAVAKYCDGSVYKGYRLV